MPLDEQYSKETLEAFIEKIQTEGRGLTKWETDFVESVAEQLQSRGSLTVDQVEVLDRIYVRCTP